MSNPIDQARELFEQMEHIADDEKCIELLATALSQQPAGVAVSDIEKLRAVWLFLDGQGELDGASFGDVPVGVNRFWWRKHLRAALEPILAAAHASVQPAGVAVPDVERWHIGWGGMESSPSGEYVNWEDYAALVTMLAAAPHPVSGEQREPSVQITGHLDEVDAPVWPFINAEARKLGPLTGSIDTYNFARPDGSQPNGVVAVLWNGNSIHAMAVTVRDSMNRTQCVRLLADQPPAQDVAGLVEMLDSMVCAYRSAIATGYDRITGLGGQCDAVDYMLAAFPDYAKAKAMVAAHRAQQGEQP